MHRYDDRLSATYFQNDEPTAVLLVPSGTEVNWEAEPAQALWLPERLVTRLRLIAVAYDLPLLAHVGEREPRRFNQVQSQNMLDELEFIGSLTRDHLVVDLTNKLTAFVKRAAHAAELIDVVFDGP